MHTAWHHAENDTVFISCPTHNGRRYTAHVLSNTYLTVMQSGTGKHAVRAVKLQKPDNSKQYHASIVIKAYLYEKK